MAYLRIFKYLLLLLLLFLSSCPGFLPVYDASIELVVNEDFLDSEAEPPEPLYPLVFPSAAEITNFLAGFSDPALVPEIANDSTNDVNATYVTVNARTNTTFYITRVRMEDLRYRLIPQPPGPVPIGTASSITYVHPELGLISPIIVDITFPDASADPDVRFKGIRINPDVDNVFEVGLATMLSLWMHIDADRDDTGFAVDQDESIELTGTLFFEGYFENGFEFSGGFPNPLEVRMQLYHNEPA